MRRITVEALSIAAFVRALAALDHETCAIVTATEHGDAWATVSIAPLSSKLRSVYPTYLDGTPGAAHVQSHGGVMVRCDADPLSTGVQLAVVVERARRMSVTFPAPNQDTP